ncbi:MAG: class III signal peptide-containing protein [Methanobrevibacter sp.]|jgi:uncharacterized protein (UPF0333 family)|nr:class III signal peptide-containing protein [Candidatus Methanovirga australis]
MKYHLNELKIDQKGQAGAELILLIGAMLIIVLMVVHFYKSYLGDLGNEISGNELDELNKSIESISSKFTNK